MKSKSQEKRIQYIRLRYRCVSLLKKIKIRYYKNLSGKEILDSVDSKQFWKATKPSFSEISIGGDRKHLFKNVKTEAKTEISRRLCTQALILSCKILQNIKIPTLKATVKYKNQPSIHNIQVK